MDEHTSAFSGDERGWHRSRASLSRRWLIFLVVGMVALFWFGGAAARGLWWVAGHWVVPRRFGEVEVTEISRSPGGLEQEDLTIRISPRRFRLLVREAMGGWRLLMPPGLVTDDLTVRGTLQLPSDVIEPLALRWGLHVDPDADAPGVRLRLPADWFNAWLAEEEEVSEKTTRIKYALGSYHLTYAIRFDTLTIRSRPSASLVDRAVVQRIIDGEATGRVRCWFRDGFVRARTTAKVSKMTLRADVRFLRYVDGVSIEYDVRIPRLDGDFNRVAPFIDDRLSDIIRDALARSLNRSRSKQRLARKRFPAWLPSDLNIDIAIGPAYGMPVKRKQ